jgi:hypothetical protein
MKSAKSASGPRPLTGLELVAIGLVLVSLHLASGQLSDQLLQHFLIQPSAQVVQAGA